MSKDKPKSSEYKTIKVTPYHIRNGSPGEANCCAIALALEDQFLDNPSNELISVEGSRDIYKSFMIGNDNYENPMRVHPEDLKEVTDFIDWFDEQCDYELLSEEDDETLENHTLTFRIKELF